LETLASIGVDAWKAAGLLRVKHPRSAVSRAYYVVYSALTHELARDPSINFELGRNNPGHQALLAYIEKSPMLDQLLDRSEIQQIRKLVRELRRAREQADYFPQFSVNSELATACYEKAERLLRGILRYPI